mgnify:CR=1 FL=1
MLRPIPRALFLAGALLTCSCERELKDLDVPFDLGPARPTEVGQGPPAGTLPPDCDILPPLSAEDLAQPPYEPPELNRTTPHAARPRYATLPDVVLADRIASRISALDDAFARRTGKHLTITSGSRDASRQAKAMYKMLRLGGDIVRLYRNKEAAREIKETYDERRASRRSGGEIVEAIYATLKRQIDRGVFISAHLRAGAVDVRNRDMSAAEKKAFAAAVAEIGGVSLLEETTPPHFHLEVE